jgi:hypothetical protein
MGLHGEIAQRDVTNKDIALLLAKLACNAITITDCLMDGIGVALFPYAAMANHACRCALPMLLS